TCRVVWAWPPLPDLSTRQSRWTSCAVMLLSFFFQAEDGIRDGHVTGVQTCALPISPRRAPPPHHPGGGGDRCRPDEGGGDAACDLGPVGPGPRRLTHPHLGRRGYVLRGEPGSGRGRLARAAGGGPAGRGGSGDAVGPDGTHAGRHPRPGDPGGLTACSRPAGLVRYRRPASRGSRTSLVAVCRPVLPCRLERRPPAPC